MTNRMNIPSDASEMKIGKIINISEEQQVQIFAIQMLAKRIFVGHYQERRYVEPLNSYRDIVCVSDTEDGLPRDLSVVKKRLQQFYSSVLWIGITGPEMSGAPVGVCLWVKLSSIPFGHYWFQIREVKFVENMEIFVRLKCLRSVIPSGVSTVGSKELVNPSEPSPGGSQTKEVSNETVSKSDVQQILSNIKNINYNELLMRWLTTLSVLFTLHNMQQVMTFLMVLLATAVTALFKFVIYLGDFSLRAMREISVFIHTCTPIFLGIIDFFSKCVGGILILITLMWRGSVPNNAFPQHQYRPPQPLRALPANQKSQSHQTYRQNRYTRQF